MVHLHHRLLKAINGLMISALILHQESQYVLLEQASFFFLFNV